MSKGSRQRPKSVSQREFDNNWDRIFKKKKDSEKQTTKESIAFSKS
jgi:hypothetical protein